MSYFSASFLLQLNNLAPGELNNPASSQCALEQGLEYKSAWLSSPWANPNTTPASSPYTANSETHDMMLQCLSLFVFNVSFQKADKNIAKLSVVFQQRQRKEKHSDTISHIRTHRRTFCFTRSMKDCRGGLIFFSVRTS